MELTVVAIKREDGLYHFDHPHNDTVEELLMNGTEEAIDTHYYFITAKNPIPGDEIEITLTTEKPENDDDYDTYLTLQETDDEGSTYLDEVVCDKVWLCPWLQGFFGEVPDEIYIKLYVPNKGLETFVKATGMKHMLNKK